MTQSKSKKPLEDSDLPFSTKPEFVTNKAYLAELDKRIPYICPSETGKTFDEKLIRNKTLKKSADAVGQESPIYIAVYPDDPYKDSETSEYRVDGRIISGRHRYKTDPNWWKKYIWITGGLHQYLYFRMIFDHKKKDNPAERKMMLITQGKRFLQEGTPIEKIAAILCKYHPEMYKATILDIVPDEWKDHTKANNRKGKSEQKNDNNIHEKCQQEIENLQAQNQRLRNENSEIKKHLAKQEREMK